jgi:hypothetical protein
VTAEELAKARRILMLQRRYVKESEWNRALALAYYGEYYQGYLEIHGCNPSFAFSDVEYFTVDNREDGLTETVFYDKNKKILFSYLD